MQLFFNHSYQQNHSFSLPTYLISCLHQGHGISFRRTFQIISNLLLVTVYEEVSKNHYVSVVFSNMPYKTSVRKIIMYFMRNKRSLPFKINIVSIKAPTPRQINKDDAQAAAIISCDLSKIIQGVVKARID